MIDRINIRWLVVVMVLLFAGCAEKGPVLLGNIKYQAPEKTVAGAPKTIVGVSPFKDVRGVTASVLGKRTIRNYIENDLVVQGTVADLVTAAFKDALRSRGIAVKDAPAWDMKTETITGDGFDVLIGGEIKTLWVEVTSQPLNVQERSEVQLRVSAADSSDKTIFKTLNMNSKLERQDLAFSFDAVEGMLSETLSKAIDQLLKDDEFKKKIH
jgi:predicted small lipoprotein YifL